MRVALASSPATEVPGLVSVVLPVYNQADLLAEAIESVLQQTYADIELIVVNDGSTDDVEVVLSRIVDHPKVRVLTQANQTLPKALSNGFAFARGEFRTWTSADNLMEPEQLARQVAFLEDELEADMVYADYMAIDDAGAPLTDPDFRPHNRRAPDDPEIHLPRDTDALNTVQDNFVGPCFLYRGWVGRLIGDYDPQMGFEDYDYWMRINAQFTIAHLGTDEPLYRYRVHDNTLHGRLGESNVFEQVRELMEYERDRSAFYAAPWTIHADEATRARLTDVNTDPHTIVPWPKHDLPIEADEKTLIIVQGRSLPALAGRGRPPNACVVAWFEPDDPAPYRYRTEVQQVADVCVASDALTAARLAVLTSEVFKAPPGRGLVDLAVAYANNRVHFEETRSATMRRRELPEVFVPEGRKRRILLQVDDFAEGGLEQVVIDLAASLDLHRFDVLLLTLGEQGQAVEKAHDAGIDVITLPTRQREARYRQLLTDERIDLVSAHYSLFGAAVAAELGVPFVQTIHNTYVWLSPKQIDQHQDNDLHTTAYICVSNNAAFYSDVRLGLPPGKMLVVPNGIDPARLDAADTEGVRDTLRQELRLAADDFVFLNTASLHPIKAQRFIVRALAQMRSACPQAKVVFLGRTIYPGYHAEVRREIGKAGLDDAVAFAGHRDDVASFYRMADAFVLPSFWEGCSLALAEALYAGLPVVASDVGAAREQLAHGGGHVVTAPFDAITDLDFANLERYFEGDHPRFVEELAETMQRVCTEPPSSLTETGRRRLDRRRAYAPYGRIFAWLIQGGDPAAARAWLRTTDVMIGPDE